MKVAVVQTHPVFGDRAGNTARAVEMMRSEQADLYVLTELFSTGYLFTSREELASLAEPADGETAASLMAFTREKSCMVHAGFAESDGDRIYNSSLLVVNGKVEAVYRKLHLFKAEKTIFDPAENDPMVIETPEACLGLMICFDWIFPEMARSLALKGAQVLCHPSNLVLPFCQRAMVTRSIENGVFTLLANRVGTEDRGGTSLTFTGASEIVDPRGTVLAQASTAGEEVIVAQIDPASADEKMITPENHLFADRRVERYGLDAWKEQ